MFDILLVFIEECVFLLDLSTSAKINLVYLSTVNTFFIYFEDQHLVFSNYQKDFSLFGNYCFHV